MRQRVLPGSGIGRSLRGCGSLRFLRGSLGIVRMRVVILRVSHASIVPVETCFAQPATRCALSRPGDQRGDFVSSQSSLSYTCHTSLAHSIRS